MASRRLSIVILGAVLWTTVGLCADGPPPEDLPPIPFVDPPGKPERQPAPQADKADDQPAPEAEALEAFRRALTPAVRRLARAGDDAEAREKALREIESLIDDLFAALRPHYDTDDPERLMRLEKALGALEPIVVRETALALLPKKHYDALLDYDRAHPKALERLFGPSEEACGFVRTVAADGKHPCRIALVAAAFSHREPQVAVHACRTIRKETLNDPALRNAAFACLERHRARPRPERHGLHYYSSDDWQQNLVGELYVTLGFLKDKRIVEPLLRRLVEGYAGGGWRNSSEFESAYRTLKHFKDPRIAKTLIDYIDKEQYSCSTSINGFSYEYTDGDMALACLLVQMGEKIADHGFIERGDDIGFTDEADRDKAIETVRAWWAKNKKDFAKVEKFEPQKNRHHARPAEPAGPLKAILDLFR